MQGQILYGVGVPDVKPVLYDHRHQAEGHLDELEPHVARRCRLLTLQVISTEPGAIEERRQADTLPAPPPLTPQLRAWRREEA